MDKRKVLFIDDEIEIGISMKDIFKVHDIELKFATSVREAKELFLLESFTDVVVDLNLPDGEGLDLAIWINEVVDQSKTEMFIRPSIVLISGCYQKIDMQRARELGINDILQKPFASSHLLEVVRSNTQYSEDKQAA